MNKEREVLKELMNQYEKYGHLLNFDVNIAREALEQSEPRMYSEEEVLDLLCDYADLIHSTKSRKPYQKEWLDNHRQQLSPKEGNPVMRVELKQDGVSFEKFSLLPESSNPIATDHTTIQPTQTEAPKEGKEEVRKFVYLIEDTHPSRQGMWWGLEEVPLTSWETTFKAWTNDPLKAIQFATFEKADEQRKELNMYGYIVTEHDFVEMPPHEKVDSKPSLEPNQTEAEKESKEQVLKKHFIKAMVDDGTPSDEADEIYFAAHIGDKGQFRVHNVVLNAMEEYASLARKQVIEEIEEWVKKEWFGAKEDDMTYYEHVVNADELLTKLQELCKK